MKINLGPQNVKPKKKKRVFVYFDFNFLLVFVAAVVVSQTFLPFIQNTNITEMFLSFRMRKRPESGSIRRTFRSSESESTSPGASGGGGGGGGGVRTASLPVTGALVKETGDKRPVSAHSILNSVTRHSSLKTKVL